MGVQIKVLTASYLALTALATLPGIAFAANFTIGRATAVFEGNAVLPGDTVTLEAGVRGPLRILGLKGAPGDPIVIRNDTGAGSPVTIRNPTPQSGGLIFNCIDCIHVVIDGTGKWDGAPANAYCGAPDGTDGCGIRVKSTVTGDNPSVYFMISGLSSDFVVRGVEVNGNFPAISTGGIGMRLGDQEIKSSDYPTKWRENIVYENNYIHDVDAEGFYIGPNWSVDQLRLRNVVIRSNLVRRTGWEGIQLKSAIAGYNAIHGNVVIDGGAAKKDSVTGAHLGIQPYESKADVFDNVVIGAGESGIGFSTKHLPTSYGPLHVRIYNNVVVDSGTTGPLKAHGITLRSSSARFAATIANNTVVTTEYHGINIEGGIGSEQLVSNNITADVGDKGVRAPSGSGLYSNTTGSIASIGFVDPGALDFRLATDSAARDSGSSQALPDTDILGVRRPQGAGPDRGAYESTTGGAPPRPPTLL